MNITRTYSIFYLVANYIVEIDEINIIKSFYYYFTNFLLLFNVNV